MPSCRITDANSDRCFKSMLIPSTWTSRSLKRSPDLRTLKTILIGGLSARSSSPLTSASRSFTGWLPVNLRVLL